MKQLVLVVDDSLTVRIDLRSVLGSVGLGAILCDTKKRALEELERQSFVAAILDIQLPDGDGIELMQEMKRGVFGEEAPILLLTTESEARSRIRGLSRGADEYIGKPYDRSYVAERLLELCQSKSKSASVRSPRRVGAPKILAVDDNSVVLDSLSMVLRDDGQEVVLARSGEEALRLLHIEPFDCVVVDLEMPGMNGLELCKRIKSLPGGTRLPLLVWTANATPQVETAARLSGADDYMHKSRDLRLLCVRIRNLIQNKRRLYARANLAQHEHVPALARNDLFAQLVAASGLISPVARGTMERACRRAGVDIAAMTNEDLLRALPSILRSLKGLLPREEVELRMRAIQSLMK